MTFSPTFDILLDAERPLPPAFTRVDFMSTYRPTRSVEKVDTHLHQEGGDVADDEYRCHLMGFHNRMLRTNIGD